MPTFSPKTLLGAFGALTLLANPAGAAVDTSEWKCESCPFEKSALGGSVEIGLAAVSQRSARFADFNGLYGKGAHLLGGAELRYDGDGGQYGLMRGDLELGALSAEFGRQGQVAFKLGYAEIPHRLSDASLTPFIGAGGDVQTLPANFRASSTAAMPLDANLHAFDLGFTRSRLEAGMALQTGDRWTHRLSLQHDVRDGTQRMSGAFFATATQLVAPVDQVTDQIEISTAYSGDRLQATLVYQASLFRNAHPALTWSNPFSEGGNSTARGQLALAPDNQFHQIQATAAYQVLPRLRASGEIAIGRMTQDSPFLAATLNPTLAALLPALPDSSLHGKVDTFNGGVRLQYQASDRLRVNASYHRDVRDNRSPSAAYPALEADLFLGAAARSNQPFTFKQDRAKLGADYRGLDGLKLSAGFEENDMERSRQDVVNTRESTLWGRIAMPVQKNLFLSLKLSHAERNNSGYGTATWVAPAENPWMRKYNLADRRRDTLGLRAELTPADALAVGLFVDTGSDRYVNTPVGLTKGRTFSAGADATAALGENTQLRAFVQTDQTFSDQAGSSVALQPDWRASNKDVSEVLGIGLKHSELKGRLELAADLIHSRSRSDLTVDAGGPRFPTVSIAQDSLKLSATYRLQDRLWLTGGLWYEDHQAQDWRLDGILPATIGNLLTLGDQAPRYRAYVLRMGLRLRF